MMRKRMRKMETALANHMRGPAIRRCRREWRCRRNPPCMGFNTAGGLRGSRAPGRGRHLCHVMHYTDVWPVSDMEAPLTLRAMRNHGRR